MTVPTMAERTNARRLIDGSNISREDTLRIDMRFHDPGYTPAFRDVGSLLELIETTDDEDEAKLAERAVLRLDPRHVERAAERAVARVRAAGRPGRGRLTRLIGRMESPVAWAWLIEALADADPKTRRTAARAVAKLPRSPEIERAVLAAWDAGGDDDRRALADALGRIGGEEAKKRLSGATEPKAVRASLILERNAARETPGAIAIDAALDEPTRVRFHSRPGLERIVTLELGGGGGEWAAKVVGSGVVEAQLRGPLARALAVRTATHVSFPIERKGSIVDSILAPGSLEILRTFTHGRPIRFRLAWARGGHRRAIAWKVAELVRSATTELVNDPTKSTWEVVVGDGDAIELVPRGFDDGRFAYRGALVAASSHPTIAAAIALVAPRSAHDVVWDPFVGAGAELVERAYLGPYARLIGTDIDPKAVAAARANLESAGVSNATVTASDALAMREPVTSIVTNPPMGRRVQRGKHRDVLEAFVDHAAAVLAPGGSLVWTVPDPKPILARARRAGLVLERSWSIDMGGFPADLAVYRKRV
jgi:predicted RNA methylase